MPAATTRHTPMRSVIISFSPLNKKALQFIETAKLMDFFRVEESPYDPQFVAKIRQSEKSKTRKVDVKHIWD